MWKTTQFEVLAHSSAPQCEMTMVMSEVYFNSHTEGAIAVSIHHLWHSMMTNTNILFSKVMHFHLLSKSL